jgi:hypothetical protein
MSAGSEKVDWTDPHHPPFFCCAVVQQTTPPTVSTIGWNMAVIFSYPTKVPSEEDVASDRLGGMVSGQYNIHLGPYCGDIYYYAGNFPHTVAADPVDLGTSGYRCLFRRPPNFSSLLAHISTVLLGDDRTSRDETPAYSLDRKWLAGTKRMGRCDGDMRAADERCVVQKKKNV